MSGRPHPDSPRLPGDVGRRLWWRSLALQAAWNHQRMQNLGLLHLLTPWCHWRELDADARRRLARRHLGYFNTNPYLAPYILGGLLRLEDEHRLGRAVPERLIAGFRDSLSRACGALGDELMWLGVRPATLLVAALAGWWGGWPWALAAVAGVAALQLGLRWRALGVGYRRGLDVIQEFEGRRWHRGVAWAQRVALILTGLLAGLFFAGGRAAATQLGFAQLAAVGVVGLGVAVLVAQRRSGEVQFLLGLALLAGVSLLI
ncbi:MAG: PTS system mannose/fructose/sorbose family transporter subunit IID [Candidatus Krumholzibacteriia bacterium]